MPIKNSFAQKHKEITQWRRDLHAHPEILFETHRTSALVAQKLRAFGCDEVVEGLGRTGVVGVIKGQSTKSGRVIALRADMDALPIHEETGLEYASKTAGAMHACGHDGHTAMLLGAANYLCETRQFDGTAVVIFQPAEEGGGGGREMCEAGILDRWNVQQVYGMHNWPGIPLGEFAIREGAFFAATDQFDLEVEGLGGHAAKPHETIDTTVMASNLVQALQTITSRNCNPVDHVVLSVTSFETASNAYNVIPQNVHLKGTIRTMSVGMRQLAEARLREICEGVAKTFGGKIHVKFHEGYPVMVNTPTETEFAAKVARDISGDCAEAPLVMGGEDFAYFLEERPGAYILMGNGDSAMVHHPLYNFNDEAIPTGCSWWVGLIEQGMPLMK